MNEIEKNKEMQSQIPSDSHKRKAENQLFLCIEEVKITYPDDDNSKETNMEIQEKSKNLSNIGYDSDDNDKNIDDNNDNDDKSNAQKQGFDLIEIKGEGIEEEPMSKLPVIFIISLLLIFLG